MTITVICGIIPRITERGHMIESNTKFKIKYTKQDGEEDCRGLGNRQKDNRPFLHYFDLDKKGYRYATNWEIL